eukprot:TRINITY_DN19548_c0_g1_i1.p2 TRINITY_DN19548_c0_g1~~TRINITY_DN19548_c0_g1_i1.p2  ORF type:complete len:335 (-),score=89.48 TRINITY_DN19548_c0_g1_i1:36-1040(-)
MDDECTPHSRAWCILEIYVANVKLGKHFEVLAMIEEGQSIGREAVPRGPALKLSDGEERCQPTVGKEGFLGIANTKRSGFFPWTVSEKGARLRMQDASASMLQDKQNILRIISGVKGEPPQEHPQYEVVNRSVQRLFRVAALYSHAQTPGDAYELEQLLAASTDDIDTPNTLGATPLWGASSSNCVENMEVLVRYGADVDLPNKHGVSPVAVAAWEGHCDAIRTLAAAGADLNKQDEEGYTPLGRANIDDHDDAVELLESLGATRNELVEMGVQASNYAAGALSAITGIDDDDIEDLKELAEFGAENPVDLMEGVLSVGGAFLGSLFGLDSESD